MLRSYWHVGLALILAFLFSGLALWRLWPAEPALFKQPQKQISAAYSNGGEGCSQQELKSIRSGIRRHHAKERCASSASEHETEQEALNESRKASFFAKEANNIAFEQSKNSAFQSVAIIFTIIIAGWAAWETGRAVNLARDMGQIQSRAYVHISDVIVTWNGDLAHTEIVLSNTGDTPATNIRSIARAFITPEQNIGGPDAKGNFEDIKYPGRDYYDRPSLGGKSSTNIVTLTGMEDRYFTDAISSPWVLNVAGIVEYKTIFGEEYKSDFWFITSPEIFFRDRKAKFLARPHSTMQIYKKRKKKKPHHFIALLDWIHGKA